MSKWVDASERLPRGAYKCLVWGTHKMDWPRDIYLAFYHKYNCTWYRLNHGGELYNVTHWRHMLRPPRKEG